MPSLQTSSSTKTTTMTTPAKLYGKDLSEYDDVDVDALLAQLSPEEINILAKEVDPDVSSVIKDICAMTLESCAHDFSLKMSKIIKYGIVRVNNREIPTNFDNQQAITWQ